MILAISTCMKSKLAGKQINRKIFETGVRFVKSTVMESILDFCLLVNVDLR